MTLPIEELNAVAQAYEFLLDLTSGREKRIPSATRKRAADIAKHFPSPVCAATRYQAADLLTASQTRPIWDRER